jgi:GNAT superfamily N-acetyltransferase
MTSIHFCAPTDAEALHLLDALCDTLAAITGDSGRSSFDARDVEVDGALFVIARDNDGSAVGCGGYRPLSPGVAELKRMFALPGTQGVGKAILNFLEEHAAGNGYDELWLETRRVNERAVRFYERNGYACIPNFGRYVGRPEAICFAKRMRP